MSRQRTRRETVNLGSPHIRAIARNGRNYARTRAEND